jgi:hypothetical protein
MSRVEVVGAVIAESQMGKISLKANGENCQLIYSNFPKHSLLANVRYLAGERNRLRLKNFHSACSKLGLSMDVLVSNAVVARLGTRTQPGPLSKLLALGPIELRFIPLLTSSFRGQTTEETGQASS